LGRSGRCGAFLRNGKFKYEKCNEVPAAAETAGVHTVERLVRAGSAHKPIAPLAQSAADDVPGKNADDVPGKNKEGRLQGGLLFHYFS
jgi:hypothetical protein